MTTKAEPSTPAPSPPIAAKSKAAKKKAPKAAKSKAAKPPAKKAAPQKPPELKAAHFDPATNRVVATYHYAGHNFKLPITATELGKFLATIPWAVLPEGEDDDMIDTFRDTIDALDEIDTEQP